MSGTQRPCTVAHLGLSVRDLDAAIEWYGDVMGFRLINPPGEVDTTDGSHFAQLCADILGPKCTKLRMAQLGTAGGTALELFEFVDPPNETPEDTFEYWRSGITHYAVVDPDVEGLAKRIEETGGKIRTKVWDLIPGQPYKLVYCEDPFGVIVEIYSHNHEQFFANQG